MMDRMECGHLKRVTQTAVLLLTLAAAFSVCLARASKSYEGPPSPGVEYNANAWKEFSSPDGHFSVQFPGAPKETMEGMEVQGVKVSAHIYGLKTGIYYAVVYLDLPQIVENRDYQNAFFNAYWQSFVAAVQGKLVSLEDDYHLGVPGRSFRIAVQNGYIIRCKTFLLKQRLFQLEIVMREEGASALS